MSAVQRHSVTRIDIRFCQCSSSATELRIKKHTIRIACYGYDDYRRDLSIYYIHFEIIDDPCSLIDSQECDLFTNHTIF